MKLTRLIPFAMLLVAIPAVSQAPKAAKELPVIPTPPDGTDAAKKQMAGFRIPEGMKVELFAAEPMLMNPVAFCLDDKGRVFVAEEFRFNRGTEENRTRPFFLDDDLQLKTTEDRLKMYEKHAKQFPGGMDWFKRVPDRVRMLESTKGDGVADKTTVFADNFNDPLDGLAAGVMAWKGDVYLTNIPNLWRLKDTKGTGVADVREKLLSGFGVNCAFLGHDLHGLIVGPDGKLYFSIGDRGYHVTSKEGKTFSNPRRGAVFRCNMDGTEFEVVHVGLRNPQELAFNQYGDLFADDNNCDKGDFARLVHIVEGGDSGWNMAYQTIPAPYMAGPWFAERLWHLHHPEQAAYIVPPIGKIGTGPAGFCFTSGSSLSERYKNSFLMANYSGNGGIEAFRLKPNGASYEIEDYHDFIKPFFATDVDVGPDGQVYVSEFGSLKWDGSNSTGRIFRVFDPKGIERSEVKEMKKLFAEGFDKLKTEELVNLLSHPEMKVRQRAQFALVDRKAEKELSSVVLLGRNQLARIHAIWGLGQLSKSTKLKFNESYLEKHYYPKEKDPEVTCQLIKTFGVETQDTFKTVKGLLKDSNPRVRYYAAEALGKNKHFQIAHSAIPDLFQLLKSNADKDPFIRHAAVQAISKISTLEVLDHYAKDESASVRLAVVLIMRKVGYAAVQQFLNDPNLLVQTEAARAVHDIPFIPEYVKLADVLNHLPENPTADHDALIRRAISAAYHLGKPDLAKLVVNVAVNEKMPMTLRYEAIGALRDWGNPPPRDRVTGFWNPITKRDGRDVKAVIEANRDALLGLKVAKLQTEALRLMISVGASVDDKVLAEWFTDTKKDPALRVASLQFLQERKSMLLKANVDIALKDATPTVRAIGLELLAKIDTKRATEEIEKSIKDDKEAVSVKQKAIALLPTLKTPDAIAILDILATKLATPECPPELMLDIVEALKAAPSTSRDIIRTVAEGNTRDMMNYGKRMSLVGGDAEKGKEIFFNHTSVQCVRCHKIAGQGGVAGPDLTEVAKRNPEKTREHLLESLILPNAKIAPGYGVVTITLEDGRIVAGVLVSEDKNNVVMQTPDGKKVTISVKEIDKRTTPTSAMPSVDRTLTPRELRDLIEFLTQLKG